MASFIILDIGSIYCKVGMDHELLPRAVIPYNPKFLLYGDAYDFSKFRLENVNISSMLFC